MKIKIIFLLCSLLFISKIFAQNHQDVVPQNRSAGPLLYEGEKLVEINKVQTLYKFIPGDVNKPLIIFVPGSAHLARISYGYAGCKEEDFLSYWFHKKGYSFLGVSYPTDNAVYTKIYPFFSIKDWGKQVASLARNMVDENHLSTHIVVLGWSMAGNIEESVQEALSNQHLILDAFIGLSAVQPLNSVLPNPEYGPDKILPNYLLERKSAANLYLKMLAEQNTYNGHEIIPVKIYLNDVVGNYPVALHADGYRLNKNTFEFNQQKTFEDTGVFDYAHTPWIGLINDDATDLVKIALIDPSGWSFLRNEMLFHQYVSYMSIEKNPNKYAVVKRMLGQIPQHFSDTVHGNHFFFVGKKGARETAQKVEILMQRIEMTKQNLIKLGLD
jgi:hypothetical protein